MARTSRRHGNKRNVFTAPTFVRKFDSTGLFYVCEDLLLLLEELRSEETPRGDEAVLGFLRPDGARSCRHAHAETSVLSLFLTVPDVASACGPVVVENVRQQLATFPRLPARRFLRLFRGADLGSAFVTALRCSPVAKSPEFESALGSLLVGRCGSGGLDLDFVYFLRYALQLYLPDRLPSCLREACSQAVEEESLGPMLLVLVETLCSYFDDVLRKLENKEKDVGVKQQMKCVVTEKVFRVASVSQFESVGVSPLGDDVSFVADVLARFLAREDAPPSIVWFGGHDVKPWGAESDGGGGEESLQSSLGAAAEKIVDFVVNCAAAAGTAGLLEVSSSSPSLGDALECLVRHLTPFCGPVRRISGAGPGEALGMLAASAPGFYRNAVFKELLRNPAAYSDVGDDGSGGWNVLEKAFDLVLRDGRRLDAAEAVTVLGNFVGKSVPERCVERLSVLIKDMSGDDRRKLLESCRNPDDANYVGGALKTSRFQRDMTVLWNRVTEANLDELLPDFVVACVASPRETVDRSVSSATEKPGRMGSSLAVLKALSPACASKVKSSGGEERSLLADVLDQWIERRYEELPTNQRVNFDKFAVQVVKEGLVCGREAYEVLVKPRIEADALVADSETCHLAFDLLQVVIEDETSRKLLSEAGVGLWEILKLVCQAYDLHRPLIDPKSEEGRPSSLVEETVHRLLETFVEVLDDADESQWSAFEEALLQQVYPAPFSASSLALCCPFSSAKYEESEKRLTMGDVFREVHRLTFLRNCGVCLSCELGTDVDAEKTFRLSLALPLCAPRDWRRCFSTILASSPSEEDAERSLEAMSSFVRRLVFLWSRDDPAAQRRALDGLVPVVLEKFKSLASCADASAEKGETRLKFVQLLKSYLSEISDSFGFVSSVALQESSVPACLLEMWVALINLTQPQSKSKAGQSDGDDEMGRLFLCCWLPILAGFDADSDVVENVGRLYDRVRGRLSSPEEASTSVN